MKINWFIAVTAPNCQVRAEGELARLGYRVFTPKLRKWVSHARVKKAVYRPILGRYLFVEIDQSLPLKGVLTGSQAAIVGAEWPRQSFGSVRSVNGVESLVGIAGEPKAVPRGVVEGLICRQMSGEWDYVAEGELPDGKGGVRVNDTMPIGARVQIVEGQFENMLATLLGTRKGRCSVKLLGSSVTRTVYPVMIRPAA